jgi:molecular chaperone GrpE (heat shock protein)
VLGTSHLETVKSLTELDQFNPLWTNRQGKTWPEIADERRGPMWVQESELLHRLYNEARKKADRQSSSPVTKREEVKRRPPPQSGGHGAEKSPPKRKNGKRLMSRREMRAASGKPFSDSSEDDSSSETAKEADDGMKPPESPNTKRGPGRPRTKSASTQPSKSPLEAGGTRRRSSSVREKAEPSLPIVDEQMEDVDADVTDKPADVDDNKMDVVEETGVEAGVKAKQEEDDAQRQEADAKKKEEADAKKEEADAKQKEEADAKAREAEESARKAEAERVAKEKRQTEIEAEEQRQAEETRKAEEQRKKLERELTEAKNNHRSDLASTLPDALSRFLSPGLDAATESSRLENEVLMLFTPLQALPGLEVLPIDSQQDKPRPELYVLNVQAAPLLGKTGLDLLLHSGAPGYDKSIAHEWKTLPLSDDEKECVRAILPSHLLSANPMDEDQMPIEEGASFQAELERMARQMRKVQEAQAKFDAADIALRWVRLQDVLDNLHPTLQGMNIEVRTDFRRPEDHTRILKDICARGTTGFIDNVCEWWKQEAFTKEVQVGRTEVRVTHAK